MIEKEDHNSGVDVMVKNFDYQETSRKTLEELEIRELSCLEIINPSENIEMSNSQELLLQKTGLPNTSQTHEISEEIKLDDQDKSGSTGSTKDS